MSQNRGKSIEECVAEIEAELGWQNHVDGAELTRSRKRVTALRNRIQKLRREGGTQVTEIPKRFPPPLGKVYRDRDGIVHPVVEDRVFIPECGQRARLRGVGLVQCIRRKGHPVLINYGHSNGYEEWCFDTDENGEPK